MGSHSLSASQTEHVHAFAAAVAAVLALAGCCCNEPSPAHPAVQLLVYSGLYSLRGVLGTSPAGRTVLQMVQWQWGDLAVSAALNMTSRNLAGERLVAQTQCGDGSCLAGVSWLAYGTCRGLPH